MAWCLVCACLMWWRLQLQRRRLKGETRWGDERRMEGRKMTRWCIAIQWGGRCQYRESRFGKPCTLCSWCVSDKGRVCMHKERISVFGQNSKKKGTNLTRTFGGHRQGKSSRRSTHKQPREKARQRTKNPPAERTKTPPMQPRRVAQYKQATRLMRWRRSRLARQRGERRVATRGLRALS